MYTFAVDEPSLHHVALFTGRIDGKGFELAIDTLQSLARLAAERPLTTVRHLVIVESFGRPDPLTRKRIAEVDATIPRTDLALVSRSLIARATLRTVSWFSPDRPGVRRGHFDDYRSARDWLVQGGAHARVLDALHDRVRAEAHPPPASKISSSSKR